MAANIFFVRCQYWCQSLPVFSPSAAYLLATASFLSCFPIVPCMVPPSIFLIAKPKNFVLLLEFFVWNYKNNYLCKKIANEENLRFLR